jgi:predicted DNA-binding transcriptional regulator YafY
VLGSSDINKEVMCTACYSSEEDYFITVFHYLRENPKCTAEEIAEGTGVPLEAINRMINSGRFRQGVPACSRCKRDMAPGSTAKTCKECSRAMMSELAASKPDEKKAELTASLRQSVRRYGLGAGT